MQNLKSRNFDGVMVAKSLVVVLQMRKGEVMRFVSCLLTDDAEVEQGWFT